MEQIPRIIHQSWHQHLQPLFDDKKMVLIRDHLLAQGKFYPKREQIFRVFAMPLEAIKVVIIGQDPYPNGEANGKAFAINTDTTVPPSLAIIMNEVINNTENQMIFSNPAERRTLQHWSDQGVFLLNVALTVGARDSGSHLDNWRWFTKKVIDIISCRQSPIWVLWGRPAKETKEYIVKGIVPNSPKDINLADTSINYILEGHHPAAETRPDSIYKFTGCNHFNRANTILKLQKKPEIYW